MEEQNKVFARNLNNLISMSGKTQKEIANEIGVNPTTFNTWCVGKVMPSLGKIQKIADYFGVGKSVLTDEEPENVPLLLISDNEVNIINAFRELSPERKKCVLLLLGLK